MSDTQYLFVNLKKRQYIDPVDFAEDPSGRSIANNQSGVMYAFALLIATPPEKSLNDSRNTVDFLNIGLRINALSDVQYFVGSWHGDICVMASSDEKTSPLLTPYFMGQFNVPKYSRWNVYRLAKMHFENISMQMIETIKVLESTDKNHPIHSVSEKIAMQNYRDGAVVHGSHFARATDKIVDVSIPKSNDPSKPKSRKYME